MRVLPHARKGGVYKRELESRLAMSSVWWLSFCALVSLSKAQDGSEAPVFEPLFSSGGVTFTVSERPTEGTEVGLVRAQGPPQETVLYGLENAGEWEGAFEIGASSGEIAVGPSGPDLLVINGAPLSVTFTAFAYYQSTGLHGNRSNLSVTVEIEDINDSPYFEDVDTEYFFIETVEVGEVLQRFTASDDDLGVNSALEYSLEQLRPNGDSEDSFSVHRYTGDLAVTQSLTLGFEYILTITATDEGEPALSVSLNISIRVDPVPPTFGQAVYEAELLEFTDEAGVAVVNVSASSLSGDQVTYSVVQWTPVPGGLNFSVGASTGVVEATGTLDREIFSRYTITVQAYVYVDATSETTVVLHVKDVNEPPRFSRSHYSAAVSEGVELGHLFYSSVKASDRDEGSNAEVRYSISNTSGLTTADGVRHAITEVIFSINSTSAELHVSSDLERETDYHYYELIVIATDGGSPPLSASSVVAVTITDVNDNPPVFSAATYGFDISESVGEGTPVGTVQVSDRDEGVAANISFSLSGSGSHLFRITVLGISHPQTVQSRPPTITTARIYTIGQLDREEVSQYELTVVARDTTDQPLTGSAQLTITVLDSNDNSPEFAKDTFTFNVEEESLLDEGVIGSITATDADEGVNAEVDFSLAVGIREREIFSLEATDSTVALRLLQTLDRETADFYSLRLQATDRGSPSLVGETTINITVLDVNDQRPEFSEVRYEVNVTEDTPVGTALLNVSASDGDIGDNAELTYSVVGGGVVSVGGDSGEVKLVGGLDHEETSRWEIEVLASDSGTPQQVGSTTVIINVVDINDNVPVFENAVYSVTVNEDVTTGVELIRVAARDVDSGVRGNVRFTLSGTESERFAIGETSGAVTVAEGLDREEMKEYQLLVTATDMGTPPLSSSAQLLISVADVNDNSPVFEQSFYSARVSEGVQVNSSVGAEVVTVTATDADSGPNGAVSYLLSGSEAERFLLDPASGEVTVARPLDYETFSEPYLLTVVARDNGNSSRSAAVSLEVTVTDANDNAPTFLGLPYVVRLEEGTTGPLVVLVAEATDPDEGENGEVEFVLIGGGGLFTADRFGNVSLVEGREVDREGSEVGEVREGGEGVISLTLSAVDNGSPIQLSQTPLTVLVSDVNDNRPLFQETSYSTTVSEALSVDSDLLNLLATDADYGSNANIIYTIDDQLPQLFGPVFVIDNQTGVISLSALLDRENQDIFSLTVSARDQGTPSLSTSVEVTINVSDANDNHPIFTIPSGGYTATLSEDSPVGSEVITVVATDRDLALHSQITYFLRDTSVPFRIQNPEVGEISVSSSLDRESSSEYNLIVVASDTASDSNSTLQTEAVVIVTVLDVNDNSPQFVATLFEGRVSENQPPNTTVSMFPDLVATDADSPSNGIITYTLTGADAQFFSLDRQSAQLTTTATFDAEVTHTYHDLRVVATDNGGLSSTVPLTVVVGDENDFSPIFTIDVNTTVSVSEGLAPGEVVVVVTASDRDVRGNALNFSLGAYLQEGVEGELTSNNPFVIEPTTGAITVGNQGLDFELSLYYGLMVIIEDSGSPPLSNSTRLLILLTDINDNSPTFTPQLQTFSTPENSPTGSEVGRVAVSDADSAELTQLQYLIIGGNERGLFVIDTTTGDISTAADIDREEGERYELIIEARDGLELFRVSTGTAVITVGDINDQTPSFPAQSAVEVEEEMLAGTLILGFAATDGDAGLNGSVFYQLISSLPAQHFTINPTTGDIFTTTQLNRETVSTYFLIIRANDGGTPSLSSTANITVTITDINDNAPQFQGSSEATIIENPLPGSLVSSNFSANDRDEGANAELTWEIVSGNVFEAFRVDPTTGALLVQNASELDYEVTPVFFLELLVKDSGLPLLSSSLLVRVSLLDANDHAPVVSPVPPVTLPEDTPTNSIVSVVTATDEDEGMNAELQFVIISGNTGGAFGMRADGSLRIEAPLDHESVTLYTLVIEVRDRGTPQLIDLVNVVVNVTDVNDNAPEFTEIRLTGAIPENLATPQIATATIRDPDSGNNGRYDLRVVSANGGSPSPFSTIFNLVLADSMLDYEEETQYTLVLEARDRGVPPLSSQIEITVNVMDIDDNPPTFTEPPRYMISESQPILTPFALLQTEDLDSPDNSDAFYYITGGATAEYFAVISQTGQLYLNQLVDRESVAVHVLEITAQSFLGDASECSELSCSVTNLTVTLQDANDNAPQWPLTEYIIGVNETTPPDTPIGRIEAVDADDEEFGLVWYRLTQPATPLVSLEEETGVLHLSQSLDHLQTRVSPVFTAMAFDNRGQAPSSTSMNIPVMIVSVSAEYLVVITIAQSLDQVQADMTELQRAVERVPGARLSVYDIREHTDSQGPGGAGAKRQASQTDVVLFGLSSEGAELLSSQETLKVLSDNASVIGSLYTIITVAVFPVPASEEKEEGLDRLTLTIVVAAVVVGVLLAVLLVTFCGCCWLQTRLRQKRKYYDPGRRSESQGHRDQRESVRYSSAEGVEFHGEQWREEGEGGVDWGAQGGQWDEDEMFRPSEVVTVREGGRRKGDSRATDSGTRPWDSRDSEEIRTSVLYESKDYVMDVFEDSDGDEGEEEEEEEEVETNLGDNPATFAAYEREGHGAMGLQERLRYGVEEGAEEEGDDDTLPMVRPQSNLENIQEAEEEEEEEEGEWEDETMGAEAWEEPSPADMITEEEARMLAAPLEEEDLPENPLLF